MVISRVSGRLGTISDAARKINFTLIDDFIYIKGELNPKNDVFLSKSPVWRIDFQTYFSHVALRDFFKNSRIFAFEHRGA